MKSWPENTIQLFCPRKDDLTRKPPIGGPLPRVCNDCGVDVIASKSSVDKSLDLAELNNAEVKILCIECGVQYEHPNILFDDRMGID